MSRDSIVAMFRRPSSRRLRPLRAPPCHRRPKTRHWHRRSKNCLRSWSERHLYRSSPCIHNLAHRASKAKRHASPLAKADTSSQYRIRSALARNKAYSQTSTKPTNTFHLIAYYSPSQIRQTQPIFSPHIIIWLRFIGQHQSYRREKCIFL